MNGSTEKRVCGRPQNAPLQKFSVNFFLFTLALLFSVLGIHSGMLIFMLAYKWHPVLIVHMLVFYWLGVAAVLTWFARRQIRKNYETPIRLISETTAKVAKGNFSVSIPYAHSEDHFDAFDFLMRDINQMIAELNSIEMLKADFVSNISHEMKTPLAIIQNYAELLQLPEMPLEQRKEYSAVIIETAKRMSGLISNVLRLNRLENQRIVPEARRYDVCRQLAECILRFENRWEEKGLELESNIEDFAFVHADEDLMEVVWNNLLSNAVKFTEAGGTIRIWERTEGGKVIVSFTDTGCGISAENLRHIFDKFYQGDTSHTAEGNGLGLALVQRVIALTGGEIHVESEWKKGSTFTVTLPVM